MPIVKLNLPPEYKAQPEYFDAWNIGDDTDTKNAVIEKLLAAHKVKTVLDLTCGTGSQVLFLHQRGYKVTGADFSPALIEIAREKAREAKLHIPFIKGDMRTLKAGKFDAAITIFNAVGHLSKAGFEKAMRNIHKNLKDGGVYVFDIFNLQAITDEVITGFAIEIQKTVKDTKFHATQYSTIDREKGHLTSYNDHTIEEASHPLRRFKSKFTLQIYTASQLKEMLARNGFETVGQYDMDGSPFLEEKSLSILTVARKALRP
jgi:2-polyprenyl-3-methyl-5-hydroxy-6-metoxy-1,4-benzoquinol methylase